MYVDPFTLLVVGTIAMQLAMAGLWALQNHYRNASIADAGWCFGLVIIVAWFGWGARGDVERKVLLTIMAAVYGLRLGTYIFLNRVLGRPEDARYQRLRQEWGLENPWLMFGYFQLQGLAVMLFSLPFLVLMHNPHPAFVLWELGGGIIWGVGVAGEAVADRQLARFRADPSNRSRVCREGFWFYSRHPNYFFEWIHWWAYVVMGIGLHAMNWWLTWIGPIVMGWALLKVTGVPLAEDQAIRSRGEDYRDYQRTTNALIPWWPSKHREKIE